MEKMNETSESRTKRFDADRERGAKTSVSTSAPPARPRRMPMRRRALEQSRQSSTHWLDVVDLRQHWDISPVLSRPLTWQDPLQQTPFPGGNVRIPPLAGPPLCR